VLSVVGAVDVGATLNIVMLCSESIPLEDIEMVLVQVGRSRDSLHVENYDLVDLIDTGKKKR
jgi:hypothetical protein